MSSEPRPYIGLGPTSAIALERAYQDVKWGAPPQERGLDYADWSLILGCEVGEAMEAFNEMHWPNNRRQDVPRSEKARNLRSELVQVAAVAVAAIEFLDAMEDVEGEDG